MRKLMCLADELMDDINMKYAGTWVINSAPSGDRMVKLLDHVGGECECVTLEDNFVTIPLTDLHQPTLPNGYYNTGVSSGWVFVVRTGNRTVKKGICDNNVQNITHTGRSVSLPRVMKALSMPYHSGSRSGTARAFSKHFACKNDGALFMNGVRVGNVGGPLFPSIQALLDLETDNG